MDEKEAEARPSHGNHFSSNIYIRDSQLNRPETLSGLFNRESYIYIYIYIIMVRAKFVLITRKEGGA